MDFSMKNGQWWCTKFDEIFSFKVRDSIYSVNLHIMIYVVGFRDVKITLGMFFNYEPFPNLIWRDRILLILLHAIQLTHVQLWA
jgi:hypothetical protein